MAISVDIDKYSGFCGGVIRAITTAEKVLEQSDRLYSLGAIVHNDSELSRLGEKGLVTINSLDELQGDVSQVLIRAHGEPPKTYKKAEELKLELIDCTCPVVLNLQKNIRDVYLANLERGAGQIVIFGKIGHAEVLGLVGQTDGTAVVIQDEDMLSEAVANGSIDVTQPIDIFSQTTVSPVEFNKICSALSDLLSSENLTIHNTICNQVANRHERLVEFAASHDIVIFVAGKESSNGKVLFELCKETNIRSYHISESRELRPEWFRDDDNVGVCGATSTPKWLLEEVSNKILQKNK